MRVGWVTVAVGSMLLSCERSDPPRTTSTSDPSASAVAASPASVSAAPPVPSAAPSAPKTARVAFVGDLNLSLHVGINLAKLQAGQAVPEGVGIEYPFTHVRQRLQAADLLVGNLECVASLKGEVDTWHNAFRCPLAPKVLLDAGFDVVSLANNHAKDFGRRGLLDMVDNLDRAGLPHFGHQNLINQAQPVWTKEVEGIEVGLFGFYVLPKPPFARIREASEQVDVLIAFMHWGTEGETEPLLLQRTLARGLIDAGVDAVVGTHAHVQQPVEWYDGKIVAHGLGNFVFSGMTHTEEHRTGDMIELDLARSGVVGARLVRIRLGEDGAPRFVNDGVTELEPPPGGTSPGLQRVDSSVDAARLGRRADALPASSGSASRTE